MTSALSRWGKMLVTTFGLGFLRPAPGTWGSMPPVVLAGLLILMAHAGLGETIVVIDGWSVGAWVGYHAVLLGVMALFSAACLMHGSAAEAHFNKKDPGSVCADETAGVCIPLMFVPWSAVSDVRGVVAVMVLAFLAFRVFDIVKLPPARGLQRHPGGVGILLDDLVAGVQAMVVVQVVVRFVIG